MNEHDRQRRLRDLEQQALRVLAEMATLGPPDVTTLPLALPDDLAAYMADVAQQAGAQVPDVYVSYLLHGAFHAASEGGQEEDMRHVATIIRRLSTDEAWERFTLAHPEAKEWI